jgi:hypothetical protein
MVRAKAGLGEICHMIPAFLILISCAPKIRSDG